MAEDTEKAPIERQKWGNKTEFLLASIGLTIGLGNIWRFPYLVQRNGGGAFLIPYFIFMVVEGIPLFLIEFAIGQRFRTSSLTAWTKISPSLKGIGFSCLIVSFYLCIYYIVIIAWCIYYLFISLTGIVPWEIENACIYHEQFQSISNFIAKSKNVSVLNMTTAKNWFPDCCVRNPSKWYFYQRLLRISTDVQDIGIGLNEALVCCLLLSWILVCVCLIKGTKTSGKVVYFTALVPYIVLLAFFFRGITLDGAADGVKSFLTPQWEKLREPRIWLDAASQIFFTLSLGFGALLVYASYMPVKNNIMTDAYLVVLANCGTSVFAGIVVFSVLGHLEYQTGQAILEVNSGPGLAFMTFCDAISTMDGSVIWSVFFFVMLVLLGIDSEFGTLEASIAPFIDSGFVKASKRNLLTFVIALIMFLCGLFLVCGNGFYIFQIFDDYLLTLPLLFIAFVQCIGVSWVYGNENIGNDLEYMCGTRPSWFWSTCWKYISPLSLLIILMWNCNDLRKISVKYLAYVGCKQDPFSPFVAGTESWTVEREYPWWAKTLIFVLITCACLPIFYFVIKDLYNRPKVWWRGIHSRFLTSYVNYLPDPSVRDQSKRKTAEEMIVSFEKSGVKIERKM